MTQTQPLPPVDIFTDGSSLGNPGPGGYGVILSAGDHRKELSGGYRLTTNNRMELLAAIVGLRALKRPCAVTLYSDSKYLVDAINQGWAVRWRANNWRRGKQGKALNPDLWAELLDLCETHQVSFIWVKGHANHPENNRCDHLAVKAAQQPNLPADEGYEASQVTPETLF
ncbi:MAG: ribonuclease HI [Anaerolineaceae bacterium]|nr:ribonuclease HI [Anaerolineaceae bacterium]